MEGTPKLDPSLLLLLLAIVPTAILSCALAWQCASLKQEAVNHGAAAWVVNQQTGKVTFEWKDCNP